MKSPEEKRNELAISYVKHCQDNMHAVYEIAEAYSKMENNYLKNLNAIEIKLKEAEDILKQLKLALGKID